MIRIPKPHETILQLGKSDSHIKHDSEFSLLNWNVYKGKNKDHWQREFKQLTQKTDILMLQEAMIDNHMPEFLKNFFSHMHWNIAASFEYFSKKTGVATASRFHSHDTQFLRSSERELFLTTPKISLYSYLLTENKKQKLLLINTHAINFTTTASFVRFLREIIIVIEQHTGPIIFAGDFNTWNKERWELLTQILKQHQVYHVEPKEDPRLLKLDHIFVRDIQVLNSQIHSDTSSSDHWPIEVILKL